MRKSQNIHNVASIFKADWKTKQNIKHLNNLVIPELPILNSIPYYPN